MEPGLQSRRITPPATRSLVVVLAVWLCLSASAAAETQAPRGAAAVSPSTTNGAPAVDELRRLLEEQRALIDRQAARLDAQDRELAALRQRVDQASTLALVATNAVSELKQQPPAPTAAAAIEGRLEEIEKTVQRMPEMPAVVSAGEFPGSIRIPGTDTAFRIGGQARMTLVHTLAPLGADDRFITSSIPIGDAQTVGQESRTTYSPSPSRLNLDVRSPTRIGAYARSSSSISPAPGMPRVCGTRSSRPAGGWWVRRGRPSRTGKPSRLGSISRD